MNCQADHRQRVATIDYSPPATQQRRLAMVPLVLTVAASLLVGGYIAGGFVAQRRFRAAAPPAPPPPPPAAAPVAVNPIEQALNVRLAAYERNGRVCSRGVRIRSNRSAPLTITGVRINGEFDAMLAEDQQSRYWPSDRKRWPVTLTIGEVTYAFVYDEQVAALSPPSPIVERGREWKLYRKDVLDIEVQTTEGNARFWMVD